MRTLFPGARLGNCLRHAINETSEETGGYPVVCPQGLALAVSHPGTGARQRKSLRVFALGQRLRHFADHVAITAGPANGELVRRWFQDRKRAGMRCLKTPRCVTSTLLDQAHNAIERKLFTMKGFHHPGGSQQAFLTVLRTF